MKIAVYTLTRDRLEYTKIAFSSLHEKAGALFDHFVLDNGSTDGTAAWLAQKYHPHRLKLLPANVGIGKGANQLLDCMVIKDYDLIIKFDNDCRVLSPEILAHLIQIYKNMGPYGARFVLSPYVRGINRQPDRKRYTMRAGHRIGLTAMVGGLFLVLPADIYLQYRFPVNLPLARGYDSNLCDWFKRRGGEAGYVEDLVVEHIDGTDEQARKYPEYFKRKHEEEKTLS